MKTRQNKAHPNTARIKLGGRDGAIHLEQRGVVIAADSVAGVIEPLLGPSM